jgi:glycosyltransferase involved in cell wall biosynthesis
VTLDVVIPCRGQERHLPRTIAALETALAGREWRGVLVLAEAGTNGPVLPPVWQVVRAALAPGSALTPGAARNAGFARGGGVAVLFVDADVEVERDWVARATTELARDAALGGAWGRIEEWFVDSRGERPGVPDLYRVGDRDRETGYTATLSLYRREALERVGGYDARLNSEEDFELGLRLTRAGFRLMSFAPLAAKHWSAPRPSFAEYGRRWRTGLCFGPGQALRLYAGRPGFAALLARNAHYLAALAFWLALPVAIALMGVRGVVGWLGLSALAWLGMTLRKRSPRLALHSLVTWSVMAAGLVVGFVRGGVAGQPAAPEAAC